MDKPDSRLPTRDHEVWRSPFVGGQMALIASPSVSVYEDTGADPLTLYLYQVRACNELVCSAFSEPDSGNKDLKSVFLPLVVR